MNSDYLITEPIKLCHSCNRVNAASCRFCRQCGARQIAEPTNYDFAKSSRADIADALLNRAVESRSTNLSDEVLTRTNEMKRGLSEVLVGSVYSSLSASGALRVKSRLGRVALRGLICLPVFMLVLLLAPVQTYTTIRAIGENA
jgi:hypothetical protein